MSSDVTIKVDSVSKAYAVYSKPRDRLKQLVVPAVQRALGIKPKRYYREFQALKNVSFEVRKGETVGLLGRNGSGKSTVLQLICGTLNPTTGNVITNGRVAALLELGAGFNPEFTGRENVFLSGAIMGLSRKEIESKFPAIESFADIGEFIDMPVKTYSSGMYVRLAFAVHAQVEPDILIVDEALAVGDARFQAKCFNRLRELRDRGTSILLVTHSTEQVVTHCDRAILLDQGKKIQEGASRDVVNHYLDLLYGNQPQENIPPSLTSIDTNSGTVASSGNYDAEVLAVDADFFKSNVSRFEIRPSYNPNEYRWGDRKAEIFDFLSLVKSQPFPSVITSGSKLVIYLLCNFSSPIKKPIFGFTLKTKEGVTVYGTNSETGQCDGHTLTALAGSRALIRFECNLNCGGGDYFLSVGIASRDDAGNVVPHDRRYDAIHLHIAETNKFLGIANLHAELIIDKHA